MKTTQKKVMSAFLVIAKMQTKPMPSLTAYKLFRLKKALADNVEFQAEEEKKLVDELKGTISPDGNITFEKPVDQVAFLSKRVEMEKLECEIGIDRVAFRADELPELSVADIEALDDFIEITEV